MNGSPIDEAEWRRRFIVINLVRIGGTAIVLIGLLVWQTGLLRTGGAIEIGLPMAILGLVISFIGPKRLARMWRTPRP